MGIFATIFFISLFTALWQIFGIIPAIVVFVAWGLIKVAIERRQQAKFVERALSPMTPPPGYKKVMAMRRKLGYDA